MLRTSHVDEQFLFRMGFTFELSENNIGQKGGPLARRVLLLSSAHSDERQRVVPVVATEQSDASGAPPREADGGSCGRGARRVLLDCRLETSAWRRRLLRQIQAEIRS